jgi:DNA repair exonuclease SbcCD ATPase subunit
MKNIKIMRLALENFKCHKSLTLEFNGSNASIYGDNASGKTSIYDALTWLLFGKDSKGNGEKNIEIKPLGENGEVLDHLAETAVEAVLIADGEEITLRRTLKEIWTTKRGRSEQTYDGNTSEYYINGVPVKKYTFGDKVDELVSEDTFRLLTSVSHFADGITWQDRRAVLFKVAAVSDDAHIMATDVRFIPLAEGMGKLSVEDYKKKLTAEKRGFVVDKTEIPARISECQKTIADVQQIDFAGTRAEVIALTGKKDRLEAEVIAIEHDTAAEAKRMEIKEAQFELKLLESDNNLYRDSQIKGSVDVAALRRELVRYQTELKTKEAALASQKKKLPDLNDKISACRERWHAVNNETFAGGVCPTCGQTLPTAQIQAAKDAFEADKRRRHREIENAANTLKDSKADVEARIGTIEDEITLVKTCIEAKQAEIDRAEASRVEPEDMAGYADKHKAITDRIAALNGELADMMMNTSAVRSDLAQQVLAVKREIAARMEVLGKESLLEYSHRRVEELQEDARNAAAALESIENMLYLIEEYTRYKTQFVEDSINSMFRVAKFRLFREQANGGIEDRCDVVYEGVPYINLNSGAKINVGIDIINTLSTAYGVSVPLFVDNAESVTRLEHSNNQIIRLVVSEADKELRVNYEN